VQGPEHHSIATEGKEAIYVPVAAGKTDVGRKRDHNEDQILVSEMVGLFAVADGMGGHDAGDVASAITTAALEEYFLATEEFPGGLEGPEDMPAGARRLLSSIFHANREVYARSGRSANQGGMGSTVVAIHVSRDEGLIHICHVGDSRCYRMRDGRLELLTRDHSMINEALRLNPDLSPEILKQLPTNVVTRALGTKDTVEPDVRSDELRAGDVYLLCSDGLSGEITDREIEFALEDLDDLEVACELLVTMANDAGGRDNISALLVRIESAEDDERGERPTIELVGALRVDDSPLVKPRKIPPPRPAEPAAADERVASLDDVVASKPAAPDGGNGKPKARAVPAIESDVTELTEDEMIIDEHTPLDGAPLHGLGAPAIDEHAALERAIERAPAAPPRPSGKGARHGTLDDDDLTPRPRNRDEVLRGAAPAARDSGRGAPRPARPPQDLPTGRGAAGPKEAGATGGERDGEAQERPRPARVTDPPASSRRRSLAEIRLDEAVDDVLAEVGETERPDETDDRANRRSRRPFRSDGRPQPTASETKLRDTVPIPDPQRAERPAGPALRPSQKGPFQKGPSPKGASQMGPSRKDASAKSPAKTGQSSGPAPGPKPSDAGPATTAEARAPAAAASQRRQAGAPATVETSRIVDIGTSHRRVSTSSMPIPACPECGNMVRDTDSFCGMCGFSLNEPETQVPHCANCGAAILTDTRYCVECGERHEHEL
jgi:protein phosphatase